MNHWTCTRRVGVRKETSMRQRSSLSWRSWKMSDDSGVQMDGTVIFFPSWMPRGTARLYCTAVRALQAQLALTSPDRDPHPHSLPFDAGAPLCLGPVMSYVIAVCAPWHAWTVCISKTETWFVTLPLPVTTVPRLPSSGTMPCWRRHCLHCGHPQLLACLPL